ncbi:MAG: hypothetical protein JOZ89_06160, partial [Gammaproteobacteria bacterium]|nr:hypothetical protein [Gammaproteobacteria bacterium]
LTTRGKWLTGIAALVAGYVMFGPKDSDPIEPARAAAGAAHAHAAVAGPGGATPLPLARTLERLAHRVVDGNGAAALFATHSWYVPPPPPPPPPPSPASLLPPAPTAPPLPYQYIGSYTREGQKPVLFLSKGDRVFDVHVGDTLEDTYSVDGFNKSQILLTYKPLNIQQQLLVGSTQ